MAGVKFSDIPEAKRPSVTPKQDATASSISDSTMASDLTPARYPDAVSHSDSAHRALLTHITEIRSRLSAVAPKQSKNSDFINVASTVGRHLTEAEGHLNNSLNAHKAGGQGEDLVRAGHTAVNSYHRAVTHVADALNHMSGEAGFGPRLARDPKTAEPITSPSGGYQFEREGRSRVGNVVLGDKDRTQKLVTHQDLSNLTNNYQSHVRNEMDKRGVAIPKGVADRPAAKFSPSDAPSQLARESLGKAGFPLTREEEILSKGAGKSVKTPEQIGREARAKAMQSGKTFTAGSEGVKEKTNPYRGVGITGFNDLQTAVGAHWRAANPGHAFIGSPAHKDPVGYAKRFNVTLPDVKASTGKTLERMGESPKYLSAGAVLDPNKDKEPRKSNTASANTAADKALAATPSHEAIVGSIETGLANNSFRESRSGAFKTANGGK